MSWDIGAAQVGGWDIGAAQSDGGFAGHVFDLATHLPADFSIVPDMGWFGIGPLDPSGPGPDPEYNPIKKGYGVWVSSALSWHVADPIGYPHVPYGISDPATCERYYSANARRIPSYYRPQTGIYSSSGQDVEGRAKAALDLGALRTATDPRSRITAWACEVGRSKGTEYGGTIPGASGWTEVPDIKIKCLQTKLAQAALLGLGPSITFSYTSDHPGLYGNYATEAEEIAEITADLVVYVNLIKVSPQALRIKAGAYDATGRLLITIWHGGTSMYTTAQWLVLLDDVRTQTGEDFFTVFRYVNYSGGQSQYDHADGAHPWSGNGYWDTAVGATARLKAADWTAQRLAPIKLAAAAAGADRVVFGSVFPGFVDWTKQYGANNERLIPRSEDLVAGQIDQMLVDGVSAVQAGTWNDWDEGTQLEPALEVPAGTVGPPYPEPAGDALRWFTEGLGRLWGEVVDPLESASLLASWSGYGVARGCPAVVEYAETGGALAVAAITGAVSSTRAAGATATTTETGAIA